MTRPEEAAARAEIVRLARALDAAGMMPSKSGNLSCRTGDGGMLITPSGLPYAAMRPEDLVRLGPDGQVRAGGRPSSEWRLHQAIYRARPEVAAVVHTHSPKATALSCARRGIPAFHYMVALAGGSDIRCGDYATFGTAALAEATLRALEGRRAALLANHGVVAVGASLAAAYTLALEVENLAGQYLALLAAGLAPVLLDEAEMARVLERFADYKRLG
ncbi:class II aldolase/adducin family protein [Caldovatus aquaticus]|uniref:Class II aldolase/adducin family protein n=1 Tax=Caldovatus aquaticus TaxID=2865671 RepID=A0ABS7EZ76_9PROT|nr:class II aldolase/adducin family protein [Caldovatus aquaticus]MBW8268644.1 class II aldolase/adducin family protein [Caldovatus aquaticus]